jgi:prepilin-type N-terminal cleavage/methylation domain-containing protein
VRRSQRANGFTLLEVIIAMAVLSVLATTVLGGILYALGEARRGYDRAQAAAWVQSELDFLRVQGYGIPLTATPRRIPDTTNPQNDPITGYYPDYGNLAEPRIPGGFYQAEIEVTTVAGVPLKQLTVRLYQTAASPPYTILVSYVSQFDYP